MENLILSPIPLYDFRRVMREEIEAALNARKTLVETNPDEYLTIEQVCKKFQISRTTIWHLRREGVLIAHTVGRKVLFRRSEIEKAINPKNA